MIETIYARTGDVQRTAEELARMRIEASPSYFLPESSVSAVTLQMVKNLIKLSA